MRGVAHGCPDLALDPSFLLPLEHDSARRAKRPVVQGASWVLAEFTPRGGNREGAKIQSAHEDMIEGDITQTSGLTVDGTNDCAISLRHRWSGCRQAVGVVVDERWV